jgi:LmbE family N-acetylglucosaminyl deacetylase
MGTFRRSPPGPRGTEVASGPGTVVPVELIPASSRLLIIAAHPDDETIGSGGLMCSLQLRRDTTIAIAHLTDGAPQNMHDAALARFRDRETYARARRLELEAALEHLPDGTPELHALGFRDQEVAHALVDAVAVVRGVVETFGPTVVMTHPYEGGHPDHDAAAFAAYAALRGPAAPDPPPRLLEMTSYHWTGETLQSGEFLPASEPETKLRLSDDVLAIKRRMLRSFKSQRRIIAALHLDRHERFREAPQYEFRRPPAPPGHIFYEQFDWGLDSATWCEYAVQALKALQIAPIPKSRTAQWL